MNQAVYHFPIDTIREDFPILQQIVNGHPLIYFDNAATTQKPKAVVEAISNYYLRNNANVHRAVHELAERATHQYEAARSQVQHFINAERPQEIVFVRGATEAINLVANSFVAPRMQPGEEILITYMEHHSNIVPWQMICKRTGALLKVVPVQDNGELDLTAFERMLNPKTKFLAVGHISNALGSVNPVKKMIDIAHAHEVDVLVDGAQAAPHTPIDVRDLQADFYVFSGHKMYGPTGIGVLYGRETLLDMMAPYQGGGEMIHHVTFEKTEYAPLPQKFEAGTPNIAGAIGLSAAIEYLTALDLDAVAHYEQQLLAYATQAIQQVPGLVLYGSAQHKTCILPFNLSKIHSSDVGTLLDNLGIAIRVGHHCAMPLMERFDVAGMARASLSFYNTQAEVDQFIDALFKVHDIFG
ncbi:MAG: SufS family cysteine desulfurase [Legionellales bacterium]|nr:SufS family cysteine desulfurase [Legionellales bacterium]